MKRRVLVSACIILGLVLAAGCAMNDIMGPKPVKDFSADGNYVKKTDNFLILFDASSTMSESANGEVKFLTAKNIVDGILQTLPRNYDSKAAMRSVGNTANPFIRKTDLVYGLTQYNADDMKSALVNGICYAGGRTPLADGVNAATTDLAKAEGRIAVIVISDGLDQDRTPVEAAKAMKAAYGDRLCLYTILIGDDAKGASILKEMAQVAGCGFATKDQAVLTPEGITDFVEKVFIEVGTPVQTASIAATQEAAAEEVVEEVKVEEAPAPKDTDGDGVFDDKDKCPGTPKGAPVDADGCWILKGLLFDTDKSDIKAVYFSILDEAVSVLNQNPGLKIQIQGHTDSIGSAAYNQKLSERRANAVKDYFVKKGIAADRLNFAGFGLEKPVADNATPEGRALNRRVTLNAM